MPPKHLEPQSLLAALGVRFFEALFTTYTTFPPPFGGKNGGKNNQLVFDEIWAKTIETMWKQNDVLEQLFIEMELFMCDMQALVDEDSGGRAVSENYSLINISDINEQDGQMDFMQNLGNTGNTNRTVDNHSEAKYKSEMSWSYDAAKLRDTFL